MRPGAPPMSKRQTVLLLGLILVFAFFIRLYHVNFSAIGYHNMKENVFISMARNMQKSGDYLKRRVDFQNWGAAGKMDIPGGHLTAWQIGACRLFFEEDLYLGAARLFNILFYILAIVYAFRISVLLADSQALGFLAALLLGILPLGNFFSRNLQPESPAFFFLLLATFYGLRLTLRHSRLCFFAFAISLVMIVLCKLSFFIGLMPLLFVTPYKRIFSNSSMGSVTKNSFLILMPCVLIALLFKDEMLFSGSAWRIDLFRIFSATYWEHYGRTIYFYAVQENFTLFYLFAAGLGIIVIFLRTEGSLGFLKKFVGGCVVSALFYAMIFSDYINQHNYYQMPFLFLVAFCSAYFLWSAALFLNRTSKSRAGSILAAGFLLISLPDVYAATMRQYDYVLFGQDVAGAYLQKHVPSEKPFFHYTWSQGYGVCVYADRLCGWPSDLADFKKKEASLGIEYLSVYPLEYFQNIPGDIKEYIRSHYHVAHMGFTRAGQDGLRPWSLIFKKGGSVEMDGFLKSGKLKLAKIYPMSKGLVPYFIAEE